MQFNQKDTVFKSNSRTLSWLAVGLLASATALAQGSNQSSLETMVVTASQTEHTELQAPASVSVITSDELDKLAVNDVAEAISKLPGINIAQGTNYGRNEIKIRGLDSDYSLILINGRRLYSRDALNSSYGNDFDLSSIPMSAIERIEVISGPMSSLYGADALGGVVNVILKDAGEQTHASIGYLHESITEGSGGDLNKVNVSASGALIANKLLGSIYIDKSERDAWRSDLNTLSDAIEAREELNLSSNLKWLINDQQQVDFDLRYNKDNRDSDWGYYGSAYNIKQDLNRINFAVGHTGYWQNVDSRMSYNIDYIDLTNDSALNTGVADILQINQTANLQVSGDIGSNLLTAGAEYSVTSLENNLTLGDETVYYNRSALYLQDEVQFGNLAITLGGRLDNHEVYGSEFSPRLYGVYNLTDKWVLKGGVGKAFKAPSLDQYSEEYAVLSCRGACNIYGNSELQAETATSFELATSYQGNDFGGSLTLFKNDIDNMISYDYSGYSAGVISYTNIANAVLEGVEVNLWYDLTDAISLSGNYTYVDAENETDATDLVQTPNHVANLSVDWQATDNFSTSVSYQYTGEQYLLYATDDSYKTDAFNIVNLAFQYQPIKHLNLKAGISNLFNEERDDVATDNYYIVKARSVYAGVSYDF